MGLSCGTGGGGIPAGTSHPTPSARDDAAPPGNTTASAVAATQTTDETCRHAIRQSLPWPQHPDPQRQEEFIVRSFPDDIAVLWPRRQFRTRLDEPQQCRGHSSAHGTAI